MAAVASILGYFMNFIYGIIQNYGLTIIVFTILLKIVLLPLTLKQQKEMKKAQELQPLVQELQRKYGKDVQRFNEEYNKMLKEKGTNRFAGMGCSGCVIQLIQIPIILGMFYMMAGPLTNIVKWSPEKIEEYKLKVNEIKMEEAISLIQKNEAGLSEEEVNSAIEKAKTTDFMANNRYAEIEIMKYYDVLDMDFFGLNLCDITNNDMHNWKLWIIPILSALATWIMTHMNASQMNQKPQAKPEDKALKKTEDEMPMPDMRMMNLMMPFMTGYIALIVPQGVGLYWVTSNILGVLQMFLLKKKLPNGKKDV